MEEFKVPRLIDEVQQRPAIWNKTLKANSNKILVGKEWNKVAANINTSKATAQNKWKTLVKKFKEEHSRVQLRRSGDGLEDIYVSTWPYYVPLSFLANSAVANSSSGNLDSLFEEKPAVANPLGEDKPLESSDLCSSQTLPTMSKKQTIAEQLLCMKLLDQSSNNTEQHNSNAEQDKLNMAFFETLLPTLREVKNEDILLCRTDISKVVFNYAYKDAAWKSINDSNKSARKSSPVPQKKRKLEDCDDDCQIVSYIPPTNKPIKMERKYEPSARERNFERQNYNNSEMIMQRRQYDQWIPTSHPPSNWNTPYYEHQIPPQYHGQHNFAPQDNQNWYSQGISRQVLGNVTHPPIIDNRMIIDNNRSEVNATSANNLAAMTQPSACFTEIASRPSIRVLNDERLFSKTGFDKENRRNLEATPRDPLNGQSSYESVTGSNTEVSEDANKQNNSI